MKRSVAALAAGSLVVLVADLVTKRWAEGALVVPRALGDAVHLVLARNTGAAWSMLHDAPETVRVPLLAGVASLAIVAMVALHRRVGVALPFLLGGALGNLVDRIRLGYVVDFIDVHATWHGTPIHWPTFNVADVAICVGVLLLMMVGPKGESPAPSQMGSAPAPAG